MTAFMVKYGNLDMPDLTNQEIIIEEAPQECDMTQDQLSLDEMDRSLRELADVANDMEEAGGMNQRLATEAERILPGILGRPIGYYTKSPTATHYRISLEEVHKGIWALVAAAAVAVAAAIYKIYKWLSGGSSDSASGGGSASSAKATTEKQIEKHEKISEKGADFVDGMKDASSTIKSQGLVYTDKKGKDKQYHNFENIIENLFLQDKQYTEARRTLLAPSGIVYDIVYGGDYSKLMHNFARSGAFNKVATLLRDKIKNVEDVINEDRNANGNQVLGLPKRLENTKGKPMFTLNGKAMTLGEAKRLLGDQRDKSNAKKPPSRLHIDDMFNHLGNMFANKDVVDLLKQSLTYLDATNEMEEHIKTLQGHIGDLSNDDNPGGNSAQIAQLARTALDDIRHQVIDFAQMMGEIKHYAHDVESISMMAAGMAKEIVTRIGADMDEASMNEGWKKIKAQVQGAQKAMQEAHYASGFHDPSA